MRPALGARVYFSLIPRHPVAILPRKPGYRRSTERLTAREWPSMTATVGETGLSGRRRNHYVSRFLEQWLDEITAPDVVREKAKEAAPKRVVTHVLDDTTPVRIGVCVTQLLRAALGKRSSRRGLIWPSHS